MKLALISDIHANLEALQATLADIATRAVDRIVCLGDIVGYNAKPSECIALIRRADALCVAGNHDLAVCGRMTTKTFSGTAARAVAWTRERLTQDDLRFLGGLPLRANVANRLLAVHGALHPQTDCATLRLDNDACRLQSFNALIADASGARVGAFGHTRRRGIFEFRDDQQMCYLAEQVRLHDDAHYLINPGAVGRPRGSDYRASYIVLDLAQRIATFHRADYDFSAPFSATRKAGLAPAFAFVPAAFRSAAGRSLRAVQYGAQMRKIAASLGL